MIEELILLAIKRLTPNAYGMTIRRAVEDATGRPISIGAVYSALLSLEEKGHIRSWQGDPTPTRGGRAKRYVEITDDGECALGEFERARRMLRWSHWPTVTHENFSIRLYTEEQRDGRTSG